MVVAALAVLARLQVVVVLAHLPDLEQHRPALEHLLVPARQVVALLALRPVLAQLQAVAAVEVAPRLTRLFSAAMAGISPSPGPPT